MKIHEKIQAEFGLQMYGPEAEESDHMLARRTIVEAVTLIRARVKNGRLVLQHNIEYGFIRNLIGGSAIAVFIALFDMVLFGKFVPNAIAYYLSLGFTVAYFLLILLGRFLIQRYGVRYAKILIQEYLLI